MMYRIVTVVFTKRKLNALELAGQKRYSFVCTESVEIGDMIESPVYSTPLEVVDISMRDYIPVINGNDLKSLIIDKINGKSVSKETIINKQNMNNSNSMFNGIIGKYNSQFIPQKEDSVRMSLSGLLCVPVDGEYVGIDKSNNLVSFPEEMTLPIPVYSINKLNNSIQVGDIIKNGKSYSKVLSKNADGSLKTLSFTGYTNNKKAVQDFVMGQSTTRVLINMFNFSDNTGFNPIFFAMANGETLDVQSLMMLSMTPQGKNLFSNAGGSFNPAMLWMLDQNKKNGTGSMMEGMMMMSMIGGQNPFENMFVQSTKQSTPKEQIPTPKEQTVDDAVNMILGNPDALAKLKEALKQ